MPTSELNSEQTANIPFELIADILCRLPVRSLLRFRCVSTSWCSLIDSQSFRNLHLNESKRSHSRKGLILGNLSFGIIEDLQNLESASVTEFKPPLRCFDISNSCNGIVLAVGEQPFLWNPLTRKYRELPRTPIEFPDAVAFSTITTYGFGYDSLNDDYKVMRIVEFLGFYETSGWTGSETKVYSLKKNAWKRVGNFPYPLPRKRILGVHLNGVLHIRVVKKGGGPYSSVSIVAFDIAAEELREVPGPDLLVGEVSLTVQVIGERLAMVAEYKKFEFEIWVMEEYGKKESWTKLLSVAPPTIEPYTILTPLAYSNTGGELLFNKNEKWLVWYDLKRKAARNVPVCGLPFIFYAEVFVGSLVSFDGDDGFRKDNGQNGKKSNSSKKR